MGLVVALHRPLGSVNCARLVVYTALAKMRMQANRRMLKEPGRIEKIAE
jgi:hypothetical protein